MFDISEAARANAILEIDLEFTTFRKGFVHAHIDLYRRIFSWNESNQWNKNFIRSLNNPQIEYLKKSLLTLETPQSSKVEEISEQNPFYWRVNVYTDDESLKIEGNGTTDLFLQNMIKIVEQVGDITVFW